MTKEQVQRILKNNSWNKWVNDSTFNTYLKFYNEKVQASGSKNHWGRKQQNKSLQQTQSLRLRDYKD